MKQIQCTLCNCKEVTYIPNQVRNDTEGKYKMYRCSGCETHFLYPRPENEQLLDYYDGKFREEVHTDTYYNVEKLQRVFKRFTPEALVRVNRVMEDVSAEDEILEIGCSVGYFIEAIADKVKAVCGTEWDQKAQEFIRNNTKYANVSVSSNPEDFGKKFDKIFLFHVLEHIEEPIAFLEHLKSVLKPNGSIYIEVPNVDDILVKTYECDAFKDYYYKKAHLYNFNEKGLRYVFERAGYQCELQYIQRYDISNHLYWLNVGLPKGKGKYAHILGPTVNEEYVKALKEHKQTDTLFAKIWL